MGPKNHALDRGPKGKGPSGWACPGLLTVDMLNIIRKRAAEMRPLVTSTIETYCYCYRLFVKHVS